MGTLPKNNNDDSGALEDYYFIASCLKMGLSIDNLKELEYKDVAKIMLCYADNTKKDKKKKATQSDWDKLAGRR